MKLLPLRVSYKSIDVDFSGESLASFLLYFEDLDACGQFVVAERTALSELCIL